jgi:hypothetical protein
MQSSISFGTLVSTSQPSGVTSTSSSIRTPPTGQVHARLDGDDHARGKRSVLVGGQSRLLMNGESDTVAERVSEGVAVMESVIVWRQSRPRPS